MIFRTPPPKNPTLHVLEDSFFKVSVNRQEHFLHIIRSDAGFVDAVEVRRVHKHLVEAVAPYLRFRVLVDLRKAKGNLDSAIEVAIREVWFPTVLLFDPLAVLVATATGRLHVGRMFREHGSKGKIFTSEHEARQYLGVPDLPAR